MITLAQVKDYLGIVGNDYDTRLQSIIDECESFVFNQIGDISLGTKTELISLSQLLQKHNILPFSCPKVTRIDMIDGVDFTAKVNGIDYLLLEDGTAQVKDLLSYVTRTFSYFPITYQAGYATIPSDIIGAMSESIGKIFATEMGKEISKEQLGPRMVEFAVGGTTNGVQIKPSDVLAKKISKYIPLHLRVW